MTVSTTSYLIQYAGTGSTTDFATGFEFIADTDLVVILTDSSGVDTTQVLTTNYTVAGAGNDAGGTVTMLVAPASGETLTIYRSTALTQATDYTEGDPFPAETHEQALDKLTLMIQEVSGGQDRALKFKETEDRSGGTKNSDVPSPVENKVLGWDTDGNLKNIELASVTYDLIISGGDAGKPIRVNATEDGIEVGTIDAGGLASDAVTTVKILDANVTSAKLASNAVTTAKITDANVTTAKIADDAVTAAKLDEANLGVPVLVSSTSIGAVSSVDLATVFSSNSGYRYFRVVVEDPYPDTGTDTLSMRLSVDGSTFLSGAGDYSYNESDTGAMHGTGAQEIPLGPSVSFVLPTASTKVTAIADFVNPHQSVAMPPVSVTAMATEEYDSGDVSYTFSATRGHRGATLGDSADIAAVTGVQIRFGANGFAAQGSVKVYGSNVPF